METFMKSTLFRLAVVPVLASGMLFAQTPAPSNPAQPPTQNRQWNRGRRFDRMAAKLNLTDAQKQQAKSILQTARGSSKPVAQQLRQTRLALRDAIRAGQPDAAIDQISGNAGSLEGQMTAIRAKAFARVYALLTPEQRTTADQVHGMFMDGHGHGRGTGAGS
jgi:Spy/CpxP family protein refolding chaperone